MRAYVLEQMSRMNEAINSYLAITDGRAEYYGWRATERLRGLAADPRAADLIATKLADLRQTAAQSLTAGSYEQARQAAQTALRLTNDQAAINYLLEIARKAYAQLPAYQKVPTGALQTFGRQAVLEKKEKIAVAPDAHQASADELLFLGLYDEAAPELETALRVKYPAPKDPKTGQAQNNSLGGFPPEIAYTLAVFYKRGNMAHRAVGYIEPLWRQVPADYLVQLAPRESIELLYPAPYADSLLKHGPSRNVDPRFLLAIMRQESRFRADVKSVAAARGLMQFISTTSSQLAPQLGKQGFRQDELYHPPTAILFGSQYVNNLFTLFPSQPPAVAAAYNAGESAMTRWQTRSRSDQPDRYVPEILFTQSKDYVYKVMANYRVYQTLYDESLLAK
jgi:soluble lytic murein transglycosylase